MNWNVDFRYVHVACPTKYTYINKGGGGRGGGIGGGGGGGGGAEPT